MNISASTYSKCNELLGAFFDMNAVCDNVAYNLNFKELNHMGDIFHKSYAHLWPGASFADGLSDEMLLWNARPIRKGIPDHTEDYSGDVKTMFDAILAASLSLRAKVSELIDVADANNDYEARIFFENLLQGSITKAVKQAYEWQDATKKLSESDLNIHFEKYTHFISIVD